jgi:tryptophan synthase beta chain
MIEAKIILSEKEIPQAWYNIQPDLPRPLPPPINPNTNKPIEPGDLTPIFPMELIKQEVSQERWIEIPDDIQEIYKLWRPTSLHRAYRLEKELGTPARIYYKNESVSPPGSHKLNTAVAQAYYNKKEGVKKLATETGAGQWGSALALGCSFFDLECKIYMVKISYEQKPYRRILMETWGAEVHPSPTNLTSIGRSILKKEPGCSGSLGIAISEAIEDAASQDDTKYSLGSVLNHVLLHQTVVGLELKKQLRLAGEEPDIIVGCVGGGSNFAGASFPFIREKLKGKELRIIAVESTACPTLTKGPYCYDFGDVARTTPLLKIYTLGHTFVPPGIHAGGLRYHGMAPLVSLLANEGVIEARAYQQNTVFEAAVLFARTEGILPAPETAHAIKAAIDEAMACKNEGKEKCIIIAFSGHGHFDLAAYDAYHAGKLEDFAYPEEKIKEALAEVPQVTG